MLDFTIYIKRITRNNQKSDRAFDKVINYD